MRKDWVLISIIALIFIVGFGLFGYLKISKKEVIANPLPSTDGQVAGTATNQAYFAEDAKVMYFYSEYCHWCQKQKDEVLTPLGQLGYKVKPMDLGANPDLGKKYNVTGTPTFIASNGDRVVGFQAKEALQKFLDEHK